MDKKNTPDKVKRILIIAGIVVICMVIGTGIFFFKSGAAHNVFGI